MTDIEMIKALKTPEGRVNAVLDTDAYNEIDDQFAIAYMLRSNDKINVEAIYAAPFFNKKSNSPKDGMEKSYDEIKKLLTLCNREDLVASTFKGSDGYLPDENTPVISEAAKHLVELSKLYDKDRRLYVVAIGAITNVASAILLDKSIIDRITVVWLGGHAYEWEDTNEFNMMQDVAAARVVFGSGVPIVQLPCMGVVSAFAVTAPDLDTYLVGKNPLATYLAENTINYMGGRNRYWSKTIWDVTAVAWLLNDGEKFMRERLLHTPMPEYDNKYSFSNDTPFIKYIWHINIEALMCDLIDKLVKM